MCSRHFLKNEKVLTINCKKSNHQMLESNKHLRMDSAIPLRYLEKDCRWLIVGPNLEKGLEFCFFSF